LNRKVPNIFDYKAAIFDLDGTLIDSMGMWGEIDIEYLEITMGWKRMLCQNGKSACNKSKEGD
jgi:phosphoglycolate phosphatase-like HAD superfamily hydrolase